MLVSRELSGSSLFSVSYCFAALCQSYKMCSPKAVETWSVHTLLTKLKIDAKASRKRKLRVSVVSETLKCLRLKPNDVNNKGLLSISARDFVFTLEAGSVKSRLCYSTCGSKTVTEISP